ncbi:MAG: hypothetical protein ABGZ53_27230 [Fuerstiella sp.]
MTVHVLTIPDDHSQWADWLEQQLVGLHLHELVDELQVVREADSEATESNSLQLVLSTEQLRAVAESGLSRLGVTKVQQILQHPDCLLELQEHLLVNGGKYWNSIERSDDLLSAVERVRYRTEASIQAAESGEKSVSAPTSATATGRRQIGWLLSTAAVLFVGVMVWQQQPSPSGRVLGLAGLLANNVTSSAEYLNRIADAGEAWFGQTPRDSSDLIVLLREVSQDCQILIDADHQALTSSEREWFVTKCRNWKTKFDETLANLESGQLTFDEARSQADTVMMKLVTVLREGPTV